MGNLPRLISLHPKFSVLATALALACSSATAYRVTAHFTPADSRPQPYCPQLRPSYQVPELPAADRVVGDIVLRCQGGCPQDYAVKAVVDETYRVGASHVSSLACVRSGSDWECVGRASVPAHCNEGS